jgi:hypothetical protein
VAIANSRLIAVDAAGVSFRWKDYRADGRARYKRMTLDTGEFIRRFLLHVLPAGFHRIRHYGLFASGQRRQAIARLRALLAAATVPAPDAEPAQAPADDASPAPAYACPCCGGPMAIIERFARGASPTHQPAAAKAAFAIDSS